MTCNEMVPAVGMRVMVICECMQVECIVTDIKHVWGKARLMVSPVAGEGGQWVELTRVQRILRSNESTQRELDA